MSLRFIIFCVGIVGAYSENTNECIIPGRVARQADYYWRDYTGVVPDDAVEGGFTEAGNITYIGHFQHSNRPIILVGNIYAGKRQAVASLDHKKCTQSTYVLILCSGSKNRFEWKKIHVDDLHLLNDYHLVKGGINKDTILYVGRATVDDQVKVGHVYPKSHSWKGLWIYRDDGGQIDFPNFEILVLPR